MNVRDLVEPYDDPQTEQYKHHFRGAASEIYPAAIAEIKEIIKEGANKATEKLHAARLGENPITSQYLPRALRVASVGWEAALAAPTKDMSEDIKAHRDEALEVARLWFQELLHVAVHNEPMVIHITKDAANTHRPSWKDPE